MKKFNPFRQMLIYKITSPNTSLSYVGVTANPLDVRLAMHIVTHHYYKCCGRKQYAQSSNAIVVHGNCEIHLLEDATGLSRKECFQKEREWMVKVGSVNQPKKKSPRQVTCSNSVTSTQKLPFLE